MSSTATMKDVTLALEHLGAAGDWWAPWMQSKADREAGIEPRTTRMALIRVWLDALEEAHVRSDELTQAVRSWRGDRWPTAHDIVGAVRKSRPSSVSLSRCHREGAQACNENGLVSVAVHYTSASEGLPRVWVGAVHCDCERGKASAARRAEPTEERGPPREPGLTIRDHRARYADTGRLVRYILGPELWQRYPEGHPCAKPPSEALLQRAAELARRGTVPSWTP